MGDTMKVYIDGVFLINFYLDFLILLTTSITLKRNTSIKRIILASLIGSISLIFLFINISNILLFIIKIVLAVIMNVVTFKYKDLKYTFYNLGYFYMISFILGGFMYSFFLKLSNVWYILFLIILSPIILIIYYKQNKKMKTNYNLTYKVIVCLKNKKIYNLTGFLDTGNKLVDPITNKPIIIIKRNIIDITKEKTYQIPFNSLNNHNLITCFKPLYVEIAKKQYKNYLLAISDKKFNMDGVDCILNNRLMEDLK